MGEARAAAMYNVFCEGWKQRIFKEERGVIAMLEQSRDSATCTPTYRKHRVSSQARNSRPSTAASSAYTAYSSSRPCTASSYGSEYLGCSMSQVSRSRGDTTRRTEDSALLRSTMARLDQLEEELVTEKAARAATETQLKQLQAQFSQRSRKKT